MSSYHLDHLQYLETEAIHVMREVAAEFERPALLFSGGKDSICLLRLAEKAFRPSDLPMPFLNVETGHEFPELIEFRDRRAKQLGAKLIVRKVEDAIADLDRAVGLSEEPGLLFNRAMALRAAGREREAVADLTRALELAPEDLDTRLALSG